MSLHRHTRPHRRHGRRPPRRGAVLLALLAAIALVAIGQALVLEQVSRTRQREREQQLQFVGEQFRRALQSYARATPAGAPALPASLDELLADRRHPRPLAHLRQRWADPFTGRADWQLILVGGRIAGLHSRSTTPVQAPPPGWTETDRPALARDWRFVQADGAAGALRRP